MTSKPSGGSLSLFCGAFLETEFALARRRSLAIDWLAVSQRARNNNDLEALRALAMYAELCDYFGDFDGASALVSPIAPQIEERLRTLIKSKDRPAPKSIEERRRLKRQVWLLMQEAMVNYRATRFETARRLFEICEDAILSGIQEFPDYPCFSTLSRIHYGLGLIFRERSDYSRAKESFVRSIEYAWRSQHKKAVPGNAAAYSTNWSELSIARALALGLGFVYHSEGQPDLALPVLLSAKMLLARLKETLLSTYVDLIYYDASRSASSGNQSVLDESILGLEKCHDVFVEAGHSLYCTRAAYSLALAYSQRARQDENQPLTEAGDKDLLKARHYAQKLADYGLAHGDSRAEFYSMLCLSRIERKRNNLTTAEKSASEVLARAGKDYPHICVAALIARAEAEVRMDKLESALSDFREAAALSQGTLRTRAICLLRLAELYARNNNSKKASHYFDTWQQIRASVSNAYLCRLERRAQAAMENRSSDFVVRLTDENLNPDDLERELHRFIVLWAAGRTNSDQKAADLIGVSRQTLMNWKIGVTTKATASKSALRKSSRK